MKSARHFVFAVVVMLIGTFAFADGLVKYRDWDNSPQGYFMTKSEREQWKGITTDEAAAQFVERFLASRGPAFAAEVASRAAQADKHLTVGSLPASKTLRGKLIIVFGPPTAFDFSDVEDKSQVHRDSPAMASVLSGGTNSGDSGGGRGGASGEGMPDQTGKMMGAGRITRNYHMTFASTPAGKVEVNVAADLATGKDRPSTREDAKTLEAAFETAAEASIHK